MLIIHQTKKQAVNIDTAQAISCGTDSDGNFTLTATFPPVYSPSRVSVYGQRAIGTFAEKESCEKTFDKLIDAYANGKKVFRVPKEEELTDDDD